MAGRSHCPRWRWWWEVGTPCPGPNRSAHRSLNTQIRPKRPAAVIGATVPQAERERRWGNPVRRARTYNIISQTHHKESGGMQRMWNKGKRERKRKIRGQKILRWCLQTFYEENHLQVPAAPVSISKPEHSLGHGFTFTVVTEHWISVCKSCLDNENTGHFAYLHTVLFFNQNSSLKSIKKHLERPRLAECKVSLTRTTRCYAWAWFSFIVD